MKKIYFLALFALSTLSYGQITNGTFDTDLTGWTLSNANATRNTGFPRTGLGCLLIQNSSTVYQNFTATVGTTYTVVYTSRHTTQATPTADPSLYVSIAAENNVALVPQTGGFGTAYNAGNSNSYVRTRFTFVATQTNLALVFARFGANTNVAVRIDDVQMYSTPLVGFGITASTESSNTTFVHGGSGVTRTPTFTADPPGTITYAYRGTNISGTQATGPINVGQFNALASVPSGTGKDMCNVAFSITPIALVPSLSTYNFNGSSQGPTVPTPTQQAVTGTIAFTYRGTGSTVYAESGTRPTAIGTYEVVMTYTRATISQDNYSPTTSTTAFSIVHTTTWTGGTSNVWTESSNWSNGLPTADSNVTLVSGVFQTVITSDVTINNLTINVGRRLTVSSGNLTIKGSIVNNNLLFVENNANLIQTGATNNNSGSGICNVSRNSNSLFRLDYTLWSSPVASSATLFSFSPLTSAKTPIRFFTYSSAANNFVAAAPETDTFVLGKSYLIRMPNVNPSDQALTTPYYLGNAAITFPGSFSGTPNNGTISVPASGFTGVGNPYPSNISADAFLSGNTTGGTLYFWRKRNGAAGTAYATYTTAGGVANSGGIAPNGTIAVGQGFIVQANASSLAFTNAMRSSTSASFFRTKKEVAKSRVWLSLSNSKGLVNQTLVAYMDGATQRVDAGIDGKYITDVLDSKTSLTSIIDNEDYVIQGRPAFDVADEVALSFKADLEGSYTIALDKFDGLFENGQAVYLLDRTTGVETDLKAGNYTFNSAAVADMTRFVIKYQKTLKVDAPAFNESSVKVFKNNGSIMVSSTAKAIKSVQVYDIQGRLVAQLNNVKSNTARINNVKVANQVLVVKVNTEDNLVVSKKLLN